MAGTAESELIMAETHLSFYLKAYRIRIFIDALRGIGSPSRICIMLEENGKRLLIAPYTHKDFRSHRVPSKVYEGTGGMEISSYKLTHIIAGLQKWDLSRSYRVPGKVLEDKKVAIFDLGAAEPIEHGEMEDG